jgi:environmental stress-induced protein Ves
MTVLQRFTFDNLPVTPWRNGGGETREIVSWPAGEAAFAWRASIATIANDGPFSRFEGVDRSITLLSGAGVQLSLEGGNEHRLSRPGEPFAFAGETPVCARLINGTTTDFNVMTCRAKALARVTSQHSSFCIHQDRAGVLYVLQGQWQVGNSCALATSEGLFWMAGTGNFPEVNVQPLLPESLMLWVEIETGAVTA